MNIERVFISYPFENDFVRGLTKEATDELKKHFVIKNFDENIKCKFPSEDEYKIIKDLIQSQELKNMIMNLFEKVVIIIGDNNKTSPQKAHTIQMP